MEQHHSLVYTIHKPDEETEGKYQLLPSEGELKVCFQDPCFLSNHIPFHSIEVDTDYSENITGTAATVDDATMMS